MPNKDLYTMKWEKRGKCKLEKDEKIIQKEDNIQINFASYGWDRKFDLDSGFDKGIGKLIKTNKRLIYIRDIDPHSPIRFWNFAPIAFTEMWYAKKLKKQDINEYFDFYFDEIMGFEESHFLWIYGLGIAIKSIEKYGKKLITNYYAVVFSDKYEILDDPLILKKRITEEDAEEMKREYEEFKRKRGRR